MSEHRLRVDVSHGSQSSIYLAICSCGWISDDRPSEEAARERYAEHVSGELDRERPKTNMMGPGCGS